MPVFHLRKKSKEALSMCSMNNQEKVRREINDLVRKAKAGSREASEQLLSRFKPLIYATIKRHHNGPNWEDVLQSAALCLLEGIHAFDEQKGIPFPAYIKTKLNYDIYNLCRKERSIVSRSIQVDQDGLDPLDFVMDEGADPQGDLLKKEQNAAIQEALAALDPKQREVIVLYFYHRLTLMCIARRMGVSYKTVQRYKARALKSLQSKINDSSSLKGISQSPLSP
jgi:RNA polymerase sigma factor (sigma-70 family)